MRKSFVLHIDSLCVLDDLSDEQRGQLFYAIYQYQLGNEVEASPIVKIAFSQFKNQFNRDDEKYATLCEKNRQIALNRHSKHDVTKSTKRNEASPSVTKSTDNKNKSDSKSDSDSKNKSDKGCRLENLPPKEKQSLYDFMKSHCYENGIDEIEIDKFLDYWKGVTGTKAIKKDWYATFRNHCRSDYAKRVVVKSTPKGLDTGGYSIS